MRVIISGGGTGGHIFPAVAIADAIRRAVPSSEILFVGANGRMEMERVPKAGYAIKGLDIAGFQRSHSLKNLSLPFKVVKSLLQARTIIKEFKPDTAVGVGGYASGPMLQVCRWLKIPYFIQEQNSFAGITNKLLGKKAIQIFCAYESMSKFFDKNKIIITGNPVRNDIETSTITTAAARASLNLTSVHKVILIFGGSLGARTLNEAMAQNHELIKIHTDIHFIWQIGKANFEKYKQCQTAALTNVTPLAFIDNMAACYKAADVVVSRAGALTISELQLLGLPTILVPSPNVSEDHQTHNAMALVKNDAAVLVKDSEAIDTLLPKSIELVHDDLRREALSANLLKMGKHKAADIIADHIIHHLKQMA